MKVIELKKFRLLFIIFIFFTFIFIFKSTLSADAYIETNHYEKAWTTYDDIEKAKQNVDIDKEIDYENKTIKWTMTYNKNHEPIRGWVFLGLPISDSFVTGIGITREKRDGTKEHHFVSKDHIDYYFEIKTIDTQGFNKDFEELKNYHKDINTDQIRVQSDINWWRDSKRFAAMLVQTSKGTNPTRSDDTGESTDKVTYEFTTSHKNNYTDFRLGIDYIPAFIYVKNRFTWIGNKGYPTRNEKPRAVFIGPFGIKGQHNIQKPDPIIVNSIENISDDDIYKLKFNIIKKTEDYYYDNKELGLDKEPTEHLKWLSKNINTDKFYFDKNTGNITITWPDNTKTILNREKDKYLIENKKPKLTLKYVEHDLEQNITYGDSITPIEIIASDEAIVGVPGVNLNENGDLTVKNGQNFEVSDLPKGLRLKDDNKIGKGNKVLVGIPTDLNFNDNPKDPNQIIPLKITVKATDNLGKFVQRTITINVKKPFIVNPKNINTLIEGQAIKPNIQTIDANKEFTVERQSKFGITINEDGKLSGVPSSLSWNNNDIEQQTINFNLNVFSKSDRTKKTVTLNINVLRDTDKDGQPDNEDTDDDNDGISDNDEKAKHTNPKRYDPLSITVLPTIEVKHNERIPNSKIAIKSNKPTKFKSNGNSGINIDQNGNLVGTPNINNWADGEKSKNINLIVNSNSINTKETSQNTITVKVTRDDKSTYTPKATLITKEYGNDITQQEVKNAISIKGIDKSRINFNIPKLPNKNIAGNHSINVTLTYPDRTSESVKVPIKINEKVRNLTLNSTNTEIIEHNSITPISINTEKLNSDTIEIEIKDNKNKKITTLNINNEKTEITGTPEIKNWKPGEDSREISITVKLIVKNDSSNSLFKKPQIKNIIKTTKFVVLRDTDKDGQPDNKDTDDDNDGILDINDNMPKKYNELSISLTHENTIKVNHGEKVTLTNPLVSSNKPASTTFSSKVVNGLQVDDNGNLTGTPLIDNEKWQDGEKEKEINISVDAVSKNTGKTKNNENKKITITIKVIRNDKDTYNPIAENIVKDYGQDISEQDIKDAININGIEKLKINFEITNIPDKNKAGNHITNVKLTYPDNTSETINVNIKINEKQRTITIPKQSQTIIENNKIEDILLNVDKLSSDSLSIKAIDEKNNNIEELKLSNDNKITGTPIIKDWDTLEEYRNITVTVKLTVRNDQTNSTSNVAVTKEIIQNATIKVLRDSDGDKISDQEDTDDDNDGISDIEEIAQKTDPKTHNPLVINVIDKANLKVEDKKEITSDLKKSVVISNKPSSTKFTSSLVNGLKIDPNGYLIGTPNIPKDQWTVGQKEKIISLTVDAVSTKTGLKQTDENQQILVNIIVTRNDNDAYNPQTNSITKEYGETTNKEEIQNAINIQGLNDKKDTSYKFENEKQIPDGTISGLHKVNLYVVYPDNTLSEKLTVLVNVKVKERLLTLTPDNQIIIENKPIKDISIDLVKLSSDKITYQIKDIKENVIPELILDLEKNKVTGIPKIKNWDNNEDSRDIKITITLTVINDNTNSLSSNINTSQITRVATITVQKDSDKDGISDLEDEDDDNDGIIDEKDKNPKNYDDLTISVINDNKNLEIKHQEEINQPKKVVSSNKPTTFTSEPVDGVKVDQDGNLVGTPNITNWAEGEKEKTIELNVIANSTETDENQNIKLNIKVFRDDKSTYTPIVNDIIKNYSQPTTKEDIISAISFNNINEDVKSKITYQIENEDKLPDGTLSKTHNINVTVNYPDNTSEIIQVRVIVNDKLRNISLKSEEQTITERKEIKEIIVIAEKLNSDNLIYEVKDQSGHLIKGLSLNEEKITGTPVIDNWSLNELRKDIFVTVKIVKQTNQDNQIQPENVLATAVSKKITILKDTDNDNIPDINDDDNDNDGITDAEEIKNDTDPKKHTKLIITPIDSLIAKQKENINVKAINSNKPKTTYTSNEVFGLKVDENGNLVGTPNIDNWGDKETEKIISILVTATSKNTAIDKQDEVEKVNLKITVKRDYSNAYTPKVNEINKNYEDVINKQDINEAIKIEGLNSYELEFDEKQIPNTTNPGKHTISVIVKYPDGSKSLPIQLNVLIKDKERSLELNHDTLEVVEHNQIPQIIITSEKLSKDQIVLTVNDNNQQTVTGLVLNDLKTLISGIPSITNWNEKESRKVITATVKLIYNYLDIESNLAQPEEKQITKQVKITVKRDTNQNGTPDEEDLDDDGDKILDKDDLEPKKFNELEISKNSSDVIKVKEGENITSTSNKKVVSSNKPGTKFSSDEVEGLSVDENGNLTGTPRITDWELGQKEKEIELTITATNENSGKNNTKETKQIKVKINVSRDDNNAYSITVPPVINKKYGEILTKNEVIDLISINGLDDKNGITYDFKPNTENLLDGTIVGDHIIDVVINYKDKTKSKPIKIKVKVLPKQRSLNVSPISLKVIEHQAISPINIQVVKLDKDILTLEVKDNESLVKGLSKNLENTSITGIPVINNWEDKESKQITLTLKLTYQDNVKKGEEILLEKNEIIKTVNITVERDTNKNGIPDLIDTDDDGDGISDIDEKLNNTDPKQHNSLKISPTNSLFEVKHGDVLTSNSNIKVISSNKENTTFTSDTINGISVDENGNLVGKPDISNLPYGQKEKVVKLTITATSKNTGKNKQNETKKAKVSVKVKRDDKDTYRPISKDITSEFGTKITRQDIINSITIIGLKEEEKEKLVYEIEDENNLPNGQKSGKHQVKVTIKYPDNTKSEKIVINIDVLENNNKLNDDPNINEDIMPLLDLKEIEKTTISNSNQTADENLPIKEILFKTPKDSNIEINNISNGLTFDKVNKKITGTPVINNWEEKETEKSIKIDVDVINPDKSKVRKQITINIKKLDKKLYIDRLKIEADKKIKEINNSKISNKEKEKLINKVKEVLKKALEKIEKAKTEYEVNAEKDKGVRQINDIIIKNNNNKNNENKEKPKFNENSLDLLEDEKNNKYLPIIYSIFLAPFMFMCLLFVFFGRKE